MKLPSKLEKVTGSLPVSAGTTALAACMGGPVAALLPLLTYTLANERQKKRVKAALLEIEDRLDKVEDLRASLSDAQYKLINEVVTSILSTTDDTKLTFLKNAVFNASVQDALAMHDATVLSRALDQISIGELAFLKECYPKRIVFHSKPVDDFYNVDRFSPDGERATGLASLGLLARGGAEGLVDDTGAYHFTSLANRLLGLIKSPDT